MNEDISKSAVINELAERMINLGYVEENFKEEIWKKRNSKFYSFYEYCHSTSYENERL